MTAHLEKVSIFVDVQNIYYTCRQAYECSFDYNKFWIQATEERELVGAWAYATYRGDEKQMQFQNILQATIIFAVCCWSLVLRSMKR